MATSKGQEFQNGSWVPPAVQPVGSEPPSIYSFGILLCENASFLLGRSPGAAFLKRVEQAALSVPGVLGVHELRGEYIGPEMLHLEMHITVALCTPIEEAHKIATEVRERVNQEGCCDSCIIHVGSSRIVHENT